MRADPALVARSRWIPPERPRPLPPGEPVMAVDLGATHLRVAIAGPDGEVGRVVVRETASLARTADEGVVPGVAACVAEVARDGARRGLWPRAVGVGVAAFVDRDGVVLEPRPFGIPGGPALRDRLASALGCPAFVDNDANVAAIAEQTCGSARDLTDFVLIALGTNVGMGIVVDGRVLRGAHGAAGEGGLILVAARRGRGGGDGWASAGRLGSGATSAPRGYAYLEELVGGGALLRSCERPGAVASSRTAVKGSAAAHGSAGQASSTVRGGVFARAVAGDPLARVAVRHALEGWALLIADVVAMLDPEAIVLSGGLVADATGFLEPLRRRAAELSPIPPQIRIGALGPRAGLIGAAAAARLAVSSQPAPASVAGAVTATAGQAAES